MYFRRILISLENLIPLLYELLIRFFGIEFRNRIFDGKILPVCEIQRNYSGS